MKKMKQKLSGAKQRVFENLFLTRNFPILYNLIVDCILGRFITVHCIRPYYFNFFCDIILPYTLRFSSRVSVQIFHHNVHKYFNYRMPAVLPAKNPFSHILKPFSLMLTFQSHYYAILIHF